MFQDTLPEIPIFRGLTRLQISELNDWLTRKEFGAGTTFIKEGEPPNGLYVIARGTVEAVKETAAGPVSVAHLTGPTVVGEMGLLTGESRSASAVARTAVVVGLLPIDTFERLLEANNLVALRIALNLGCIVSHRMREALRRLAELEACVHREKPSPDTHRRVTRVIGSVYSHALTGKGD
ncbi:MAG: cyclic nucleotide-binding domain-containing protein [Planctomycetota bacterium]|nr:cyclic nucleotide-binding domain-containing protein [Planctomycetota bacterium]